MNCVCHSFGPLLALRILLGVFESATAPRFVIQSAGDVYRTDAHSLNVMTTMWYKRHEQSVRTGYWYQGTSIGPAVSSLIAFGFTHWAASSPNAHFKPWQVLFLLYGLVTITLGILVVLLLPDNPMKSRLTHAEKLIAIERIRENQTGIENKHFKWPQFRETMLDVRTWLLCMLVIATNVPNGAVSSFSSQIIQK
jgi:sugar phosphate permease